MGTVDIRSRLWIPFVLVGASAAGLAYIAGGELVAVWVSPAIALCGAFALVAGLRMHRPGHPATWAVLGLGLVLEGTGDAVWAVISRGGTEPVSMPSLADVFYIAGYLALVAGVLLLVHHRMSRSDPAAVMDAAIVALAFCLVAWVCLIDPVTTALMDTTPAGLAVAAAYPLADLVVLAVLLRALFEPQARTPTFALLTAGISCVFLADTLYLRSTVNSTWSESEIADFACNVGYLLWGAALLHPSVATMAQFGTRRPRFAMGKTATVAGACVLPFLALLWAWHNGDIDDIPVIAVLAAALTALWTIRVTLVARRLHEVLNAREALEHRLREQAESDSLVDLPNRLAFAERLAAALASNDPVAVLYIDLDDFKYVNDTYGHGTGDALLMEVARRIERAIRPSDLAARLGGDEFAVLVAPADAKVGLDIAARILDAFRDPFAIDGRIVHAHASIGVAAGDGRKPADEFLREADVAMYLAKGRGKSRIEAFDQRMYEGLLSRIALRSEFEEALATGEFALEYQPIVTMNGSEVLACEALVRWRHPTRGLLPPVEFIDIAEDTGLIVPLGWSILETACLEAKRWQATMGDAAPAVSVNVSALQFRSAAFVETVFAVLERTGLDPTRLILEVTESALIEGDAAAAEIHLLAGAGIRLALDDFGTGYSSLAYLARYEIAFIKLAQGFVSALGTGDREDRLAAAIVKLGHDLGMKTIAEGVETDDQRELLGALDCGWIQGFLAARPMPTAMLSDYLFGRQEMSSDAA